jgi:hypothetical protein
MTQSEELIKALQNWQESAKINNAPEEIAKGERINEMVEKQSAWFHNQFLKAKIEGTLNAYEVVIREIQVANNFSDLQGKVEKYRSFYKEQLKEIIENE